LTPSPVDEMMNDPLNWFVAMDFFFGVSQAASNFQSVTNVVFAQNDLPSNKSRWQRHTDGLIVMGFQCFSDWRQISGDFGGPVVVVEEKGDYEDAVSLRSNQAEGVRKGVRRLTELGHRRIGIISGSPQRHSQAERIQGYRSALAEADIEPDESIILQSPGSRLETMQVARGLLQSGGVSAVFCTSDMRALGVLDAARELGLKVPEELTVLGFDDIPAGREHEPPLSTIRHPRVELGDKAVEVIMSLLAGTPVNKEVVIETEYIERGTTGRQKEGGMR